MMISQLFSSQSRVSLCYTTDRSSADCNVQSEPNSTPPYQVHCEHPLAWPRCDDELLFILFLLNFSLSPLSSHVTCACDIGWSNHRSPPFPSSRLFRRGHKANSEFIFCISLSYSSRAAVLLFFPTCLTPVPNQLPLLFTPIIPSTMSLTLLPRFTYPQLTDTQTIQTC